MLEYKAYMMGFESYFTKENTLELCADKKLNWMQGFIDAQKISILKYPQNAFKILENNKF